MKINSYIWIALAVLLAMPVTQAAVILNPGQSHNCTAIDEIVSCGLCPLTNTSDCPDCNITCGTCSVEKELNPGFRYLFQSGPCDLDITCEETDCERDYVDRVYTMSLWIEKMENMDAIDLTVNVKDFTGFVVDARDYSPFRESDVVSSKYVYNFTCPTEVFIDNLDFEGCSKYFDKYFESSEPLAMVLATGNRDCVDKLVACQGNIEAEKSLARDYKAQWEDCKAQMHTKDLSVQNMNDTLEKERLSFTGKTIQIERETVPIWWMTAAIIEAVIILIGIGALIFGGGED